MVYISDEGQVLESTPWTLGRILSIPIGILNTVFLFFRTLVDPSLNSRGIQYTQDYRLGSGPPRPPTRRMGRPNTGSVSVPFGGCRSCAG
ncbi:selenoprotein K-like [Orussus abietinus]|uniref:selenoprotein K-like n=1 Tax=Orussus abietinus TaxID=222816 RepID=UPI0006254B8C|nr:selenoprotein K-like [Orussus abietinus]